MKKIIFYFFIAALLAAMLVVNIQFSLAESNRYVYDGTNLDTSKYPGFKEKLDALQETHPNWTFIIMETGLDFDDVISAEYTGHFSSPKNLIQGKSGSWICTICGETTYDTGSWYCASEQTIRYYMDTRNWLVDSPYLFQFLQTDYLETTDEKVYNSLNGTFLYSMEYATVINSVCKTKNANPYYVIARLLQEQGSAGGVTAKMTDTDGTVYYNLFNIGASGSTADEVYANALARAKSSGWTSMEACLTAGISFLFSSYIDNKQNSIYLNKFDVESYDGLYTRQYMQNIEAPKTEGTSMYNKMKSAGLLDENLTFIIPVYEGMSTLAATTPDSSTEIYPKNIAVKEGHSNVMIRAGRGTSYSVVGRIEDSSVIVLSVERYSDGWHKVILTDGTSGYVKFNTDYLEEIDDITNCYEEVTVANDDVILRAGPGFSEAEITMLEKGQTIYRIDNTGRYEIDGKIWDRVILEDSRQGFIVRDNIEVASTDEEDEDLTENTTLVENVVEVTNSTENEVTNEAENEPTNETENLMENLVQNETTNEVVEEEITEEITTDRIIIVEITATAGSVTSEGIYRNGESIAEDEMVATGDVATVEGVEYYIVKIGDCNGDGYVKANDYLIIKDYIMETGTADLSGVFMTAADVTGDGYVKANDYLKIKNYIMSGEEL